MNRSILIVICDFLLVSLLAFSTVDINRLGEVGNTPTTIRMEIAPTNNPGGGRDVSAVLRAALDEEKRQRDLLMGELARHRETLAEQQAVLSDRDQQVRTYRQQLETVEQRAARIEAERQGLHEQFSSAQSNIMNLASQLKQTTTRAVLSNERLAAMEEELKRQTEQATGLQKQITALQESNQVVLSDRMRLSTQLQVAEVEKRIASQQVAQMSQQVQAERQERAILAEGVKTLATNSQVLAQEIRENRALTPNTIFFEVLTNRVQVSLQGRRPGVFGNETAKRAVTQTVLIEDGTNVFAMCHIDDTPLALANPAIEWEGLTGTMAGNARTVPIKALSFYRRDPRLILIPVPRAEVDQLGVKTYRSSDSPYKFQDAVLVGAREGYYGECRFQIDVTTPDYLKLDNSFIRGLFGKFNPSQGDLVFSKTGELLGVMVNNSFCLMLQKLDTAATIRLENDIRNQRPGRTLAQLSTIVQDLPPKLR